MSYNTYKWCPYEHKYELVQWAVTYKGLKRYKAQKISKQGLYAMWYKRNEQVGSPNLLQIGEKQHIEYSFS